MGMFPVVVSNFAQTLNDVRLMDFDGKFAATIETAGGEIDGANNGTRMIREEHFAVKFEVLEFVDLDANIVHDAQPADAFGELSLLEFVGRSDHDVNFDAALLSTDEALDDDGVLIAFILDEESVLGIVDKAGYAFAAITITPNEEGAAVHAERFALPIGLKAFNDFLDLVRVSSDNGVVASVGEIFEGPIEGLDESKFIVDHYGLFVGDVEFRIAIDDIDAGNLEFLARILVFALAAAASRIEHDADVNTTLFSLNDGVYQVGMGEQEHFNANGFLGVVDGI
jgi:hypothetical protein